MDQGKGRQRDVDAAAAATGEGGTPPVWSLIVTVFGDVAAPRGGALPTAAVLWALEGLGIAAPTVRTALSRLVAEGWLVSHRDGRRSHHAMTARAAAETASASRRIYGGPRNTWPGWLTLAVVTEGAPGHDALLAAGFAPIGPTVFVAPDPASPLALPEPGAVIVLKTQTPELDAARRLMAQAYPLAPAEERAQRFRARHAALLDGATPRDPAEAMVARLRLIHDWRRLVLREPAVPLVLRPPPVAMQALYPAMARAYRRLLEPSEAWWEAALAASGEGPSVAAQHVTRIDEDRFPL